VHLERIDRDAQCDPNRFAGHRRRPAPVLASPL
jgi:hypothetical protein